MAARDASPGGYNYSRRLSPSPSPLLSPTSAAAASLPSSSPDSNLHYSSSTSPSTSSSTRSASLGPLSATDSSSSSSRQSSASYTSRQSMGGLERPRRRGYVRPQGTNFAASAQSRESVMSLGSIAHLQYYFARTGLLDGKGGQLAKRKDPAALDLSSMSLDGGNLLLSPTTAGHPSDKDFSYSSMRSSPELAPQHQRRRHSGFIDTPTTMSAEPDTYDYSSDDSDSHPAMLPPTVSTYNHRPKPIPRPPTLQELKSTLESSLRVASAALTEATSSPPSSPSPALPTISHLRTPSSISSPSRRRSESDATVLLPSNPPPTSSPSTTTDPNQGWHELQGMHILDVTTLAIRAARHYYTAHAHPSRLSSIRSERLIRADLLTVMDCLRRLATRNFAHGLRPEEARTMRDWIAGVWDMLAREEAIEREELRERQSWTWLDDRLWHGSGSDETGGVDIVREVAFLRAIAPSVALPEYEPSDLSPRSSSPSSEGGAAPPTPGLNLGPFWASLRTGLVLVQCHNAMVRRSKRPFGGIETFHTDTGKPYRCAENLRFWIKAAELRWEVRLSVDVMGVVAGVEAEAWRGFEAEVWRWVGRVREELAVELRG